MPEPPATIDLSPPSRRSAHVISVINVCCRSSIFYVGLDVHKDSITIAVLPASAKNPTRLDRLPNDLPKLKRHLDRLARAGAEVRSCYEASAAGYVLHRALRDWGYACEVIAPSLFPKRAGVKRRHDKRDAAELARLVRAGELVPVRILSEAEERVRDLVCAVARRSSARSSSCVTIFSHSLPGGASSIARARTGARRISAGSST